MDYMIINGFNTSTIPGCNVTDFGEVEAAKPKGEVAELHGVNGSYRVLDGSYDSYDRTFTIHVTKLIDISIILDKFQSNDNELEFRHRIRAGADAGLDGRGGPGPHLDERPGHLLVPQPSDLLDQGGDLRQPPARDLRSSGLRRRHRAAARRTDRGRLPHG